MEISNINIKERLLASELFEKICDAKSAAMLISDGMTVGVSGFTLSGYPKAVTLELAKRAQNGEQIKIDLYSGASVGPEIDGVLADAGVIRKRLPYQTDKSVRNKINSGEIEYVDIHLSQSPQFINYNVLNKIDIAIVEALGITQDGHIIPTTSVGNTPSIVKNAEKVIVELNIASSPALWGMADIYILENPPYRKPIEISSAGDRIGTPYIECGTDKIAAIVLSDIDDRHKDFVEPDETSKKISENIIAFLRSEVEKGRLTNSLLPLQSGVGGVANAVLYGLLDSEFDNLTFYTEVMQDSMLNILRSGRAKVASTTAISLSQKAMDEFLLEAEELKDKIVLRPQEISNHPEVIRRLGVMALNTAIEVDIYGNVNSTHILGTKMMNGIGGSGDFSRNAAISIFSTPSMAKGGKISSVVPMVSHVDHTEHDVNVIVTEYGYADLRGLSPKERAKLIIENCAHPDYKEELKEYFERACEKAPCQTPHIIEEALSWHERFIKTGDMRKGE